jgi:hypothetical protein
MLNRLCQEMQAIASDDDEMAFQSRELVLEFEALFISFTPQILQCGSNSLCFSARLVLLL